VDKKTSETAMQQNLRMHAGTTAADPAETWMKLGWLAIAVGGIYILSAKLSLSLLTPDGVAVFWPAAGVAAGALIAAGPWARWAVVAGTMVATIVANLMGDRNSRELHDLCRVQCGRGAADGRPDRALLRLALQP
jgi:hypothetical protein